MATKIPLHIVARIWLLRTVIATSVACLSFLGFGIPLNDDHFRLQDWLALGLIIFSLLVHHCLIMSLNIDFCHGLVDLPLLLAESTGLFFYNIFCLYDPNLGWRLPPPGLFVFFALFIFHSLEAVLRIGSLVTYIARRCQGSSQYRSIVPQENLKPYQVIFGCSVSTMNFNASENPSLSTAYYTSHTQMKFVLAAKRFLLRFVLASSVGNLVLLHSVWPALKASSVGGGEYGGEVCIELLPFIIFHHFVSCINLEFDYVFADLPALLFEIGSMALYIRGAIMVINPWLPSSFIGYAFFSVTIFACLVLELLLWGASLVAYMIRRIFRSPASSDFTGQKGSSLYEVLLGHSVLKVHLIGERAFTRVSRGLIGSLFITVVFLYSVNNIILYPIQESGLTPTKEFRTSQSVSVYFKASDPAWNVLFITPLSPQSTNFSTFQAAVNVTQLQQNDSENSQCDLIPVDNYFPPGADSQLNVAYCGEIPVDLLITVNFTTLQIPVGTLVNMSANSLQIMIGLTSNTQWVIDSTPGTTLIPGTSLFGIIASEWRQRFNHQDLSAFSPFFDSYDTFMVARMLIVITDPLVPESPFIPHARDIATLRISLQPQTCESRISQDYRSHSVLQGFSTVGGLWTSLTLIFAVIFGSSIIRIIFGKKLLSFGGVFHSIQNQHIKEASHKRYPRIKEQIHKHPSERGLVDLICDHFIDMKFLAEDEESRGDITVSQAMDQDEERISLEEMH